jgi:hypothetical protein
LAYYLLPYFPIKHENNKKREGKTCIDQLCEKMPGSGFFSGSRVYFQNHTPKPDPADGISCRKSSKYISYENILSHIHPFIGHSLHCRRVLSQSRFAHAFLDTRGILFEIILGWSFKIMHSAGERRLLPYLERRHASRTG